MSNSEGGKLICSQNCEFISHNSDSITRNSKEKNNNHNGKI